MIAVHGLGVRLGRARVVDDVSFEMAPGRSIALWGANGAGKTTILRAVLDQVPYTGTIRVGGLDAHREGRRVRGAIGYVPQRLAFHDDLTALGLVRFLAGLRGVAPSEALTRLERVGLSEHARKAVGALSGGMKQRLALAAALLGDPPLLLLDEPSASLDEAARADFTALLGTLRAAGKSLLVTSHRLEEVTALADSVVVLDRGRVRMICPAGGLAAALHPFNTLRLALPEGEVEAAMAALSEGGFDARRNGHGIHVRVAAGQRAVPITLLARAGVTIDDLEIDPRADVPS